MRYLSNTYSRRGPKQCGSGAKPLWGAAVRAAAAIGAPLSRLILKHVVKDIVRGTTGVGGSVQVQKEEKVGGSALRHITRGASRGSRRAISRAAKRPNRAKTKSTTKNTTNTSNKTEEPPTSSINDVTPNEKPPSKIKQKVQKAKSNIKQQLRKEETQDKIREVENKGIDLVLDQLDKVLYKQEEGEVGVEEEVEAEGEGEIMNPTGTLPESTPAKPLFLPQNNDSLSSTSTTLPPRPLLSNKTQKSYVCVRKGKKRTLEQPTAYEGEIKQNQYYYPPSSTPKLSHPIDSSMNTTNQDNAMGEMVDNIDTGDERTPSTKHKILRKIAETGLKLGAKQLNKRLFAYANKEDEEDIRDEDYIDIPETGTTPAENKSASSKPRFNTSYKKRYNTKPKINISPTKTITKAPTKSTTAVKAASYNTSYKNNRPKTSSSNKRTSSTPRSSSSTSAKKPKIVKGKGRFSTKRYSKKKSKSRVF